MSEGVISKAALLLQAVSNDALDNLLKKKAVPVLKIKLQELRETHEEMVGEAAKFRSLAATSAAAVKETEAKIAKLVAVAKQFASDNILENDADGEAAMAQAIRLKGQGAQQQTLAATNAKLAEKYTLVEQQLAMAMAKIQANLRTLEATAETTAKVKDGNERLSALDDILRSIGNNGDGVEGVIAGQNADLAAATAQFEATASRVGSNGDTADPLALEAKALMAQLRAGQDVTL